MEDIVWTQEEPLNAGAWSFAQPRMDTILEETKHHKDKKIKYAGRPPSASVATGMKKAHINEQEGLLKAALRFNEE